MRIIDNNLNFFNANHLAFKNTFQISIEFFPFQIPLTSLDRFLSLILIIVIRLNNRLKIVSRLTEKINNLNHNRNRFKNVLINRYQKLDDYRTLLK